jgi:ATP-dependent helicase/nuclease subunit A
MTQPSLFDPAPDTAPALPDQRARDFAMDPRNDVVLEASAGTGKTSVLVGRYVRLIDAGVEPRNILAITFTRKAAAEMRDRVLVELGRRAAGGTLSAPGARALRDRLAEIQISTIDAFCFSLLREFPLEAGVDPAFEIADETEAARLATEALDVTLRAARALIPGDEPVRLLFARVKLPVLRAALASLIDRRQVALPAVAAFVKDRARHDTAAGAAAAFVARLRAVLSSPHRPALLDDGPLGAPEFRWLHADLTLLAGGQIATPGDRPGAAASDAGIQDPAPAAARVQQLRRRLQRYFLTRAGTPRRRLARTLTADWFASTAARTRHEQAMQRLAPAVLDALDGLDRDVNGLLARGLLRVLAIAVTRYERLLDEHALLDFTGLLDRSVRLLARQEEFARSRLKLQSRFHHLLVDEFQDTSRLQWRLIELLVDAWGEGEGATDAPTSIFVVGDRKQSIYRFRQAEVTLLDEAARKIEALRPGRAVRQAIRTSFRAVPELLAFVNALSESLQSSDVIDERFRYREDDRFPVPAIAPGALRDGETVLGVIAEASMPAMAAAVAAEAERLLATAIVRDRHGPPRPARPDDIAILFRARTGYQYFEDALEARGIRTYVYKGLGFFDAPEVQDLQALVRYLAQPDSDLRAAELLRSRLIRLSDDALARLAPDLARAIRDPAFEVPALDDADAQLLAAVRNQLPGWLALADRVTPTELVDHVLAGTAYAFELRGRRHGQARENVKKLRALMRRIESRGYATLGRLAACFETLRAGEQSHAVVEASGCVNLMTIHAAKGLEFPIVFVVNLHLPARSIVSGGVKVIERGADGQPDVAFGSTESTALEERREREELRRLLYVAVTRARDRLYLAGQVDEASQPERGARSLAALLPAGLSAVFGAAALAPAGARVTWQAGPDSFTFAVCRAPGERAAEAHEAAEKPWTLKTSEPLAVLERRRVPATPDGLETPAHTSGHPVMPPFDPSDVHSAIPPLGRSAIQTDRLIGTLVHRLLQRGAASLPDEAALAPLVLSLAGPEELVDIDDRHGLARQVGSLYEALRSRPDVRELLASGRCAYEVPFSYAAPDRPGELIRGVMDCVVFAADGTATVVEFKTGSGSSAHDAQAALYGRALASALGVERVNIRILYP